MIQRFITVPLHEPDLFEKWPPPSAMIELTPIACASTARQAVRRGRERDRQPRRAAAGSPSPAASGGPYHQFSPPLPAMLRRGSQRPPEADVPAPRPSSVWPNGELRCPNSPFSLQSLDP